MKNKMNFSIVCLLVAAFVLFFALLPSEDNFLSAIFHCFWDDEDGSSSVYNDMPQRPVLKEAKGINAHLVNPELTDRYHPSPVPMGRWLQGLRLQIDQKATAQTRKFTQSASPRGGAARKKRSLFRRRRADLTEKKENRQDPADAPFLLWRELHLCEDNCLLINLMLVNNRRQEQSHGVIVSQTLPAGWSLSAAWPKAQVIDQEKGELKWLFAEAASRYDWPLQVVLVPDEGAEMPLLPEKSTTLRCCLPEGELMQYNCMSLR